MSLEQIKADSNGLRGPLPIELENADPKFTEAAKQVLKFHGIYQQHDRDIRGRKNRHYEFMVRSKLPGGKLTAHQYLVHDALSDEFGQGSLRLTTRQGIQIHGVIKGNLHGTLQGLNAALVSTLAACGDVERNVMCCPAPHGDPVREQLQAFARQIADHLCPRTTAYHEIWLVNDEGKKVRQRFDNGHRGNSQNGKETHNGKEGTNETVEVDEPIYGKAYLPRKFKTAIAFPGDNCTDILTNDVGLVALVDEESGRVHGFNVYVGGGMGKTHNKEETFARLADPLGYVPVEKALDVVEKIVLVQRDYGDRENRRHARMKYLIHDWGLERFRSKVHEYLGYELAPLQPQPSLEMHDHLGWQQQADGRWFYGVYIENGRIQDSDERQLRSGLRAIIEKFQPTVYVSAQQNLLLSGFRSEQKTQVEGLLHTHGIRTLDELSTIRRNAMACPALPTCGLAITEAERRLPGLLDGIEEDVAELGLDDEAITIRMTGCPNGCARPYVSDIGIVGRSLDKYEISLGGNPEGTRLNRPFADVVHADDLRPLLRNLLATYKQERTPNERFGDWADRLGLEAVRDLLDETVVPA